MSNKLQIVEGSSIHKLVTFWDNEYIPSNFCDCFWQGVKHLLMVVFFTAIGAGYLGALLGEIAGIVMSGYTHVPLVTGMTLVIVGAVAGIVGIIVASEKIKEGMTNTKSKTLSDVKVIYTSWKEKWCPLVEEVTKD